MAKKGKKGKPPEAGGGGGVWDKIGWLQLFDRAVDTVANTLPAFTHSIQVAVAGGPNADIRRIWYLAVSAVFGRLRNGMRTAFSGLSMDTTWDVSGKTVSIEVTYQMNALSNFDRNAINLSDPTGSPLGLLVRGPEQLTVGGDWTNAFADPVTRLGGGITIVSRPSPTWWARFNSAFGGCIAGNPQYFIRVFPVAETVDAHGAVSQQQFAPSRQVINILRELPEGGSTTQGFLFTSDYPYKIVTPWVDPVTSAEPAGLGAGGSSIMSLPDSGRVITTVEKKDIRVQPPKPPADGHTRGSLLALVAQGLQTPCFLPDTPPCTVQGSGRSGVYVQPRGTATTGPAALVDLWKLAPGQRVDWQLGDLNGPDGYPLPPTGQVTNYADS